MSKENQNQESVSEQVFVAFRNEFFQGDLVNRVFIGVFSSQENADNSLYELEADTDTLFDPMFRTTFDVVPTFIDVPFEDE